MLLNIMSENCSLQMICFTLFFYFYLVSYAEWNKLSSIRRKILTFHICNSGFSKLKCYNVSVRLYCIKNVGVKHKIN